jgi:hypothetical protein
LICSWVELLAESVFARPHFLRDAFRNDGNVAVAVDLLDQAALAQGNTHGLEISGTHMSIIRDGSLQVLSRAAGHVDGIHLLLPLEREPVDPARGIHCGECAHPRQHVIVELFFLLRLRVALRRQAHVHGEHVLRRESLIDAEQADHARGEQAGNDQRLPQAACGAALRDCSSACFQRLLRLSVRHAPRGQGAEEASGQYGNEDREPQHARVHVHFINPRQIGRRHGHQPPQPEIRQANAEDSSEDREQCTLRQQLPRQSSLRSSQRRPNARLPHPAWNAHQQQVREVQANDQEHCPHAREQEQKSAPCRSYDRALKRNDLGAKAYPLLCVLGNPRLNHI